MQRNSLRGAALFPSLLRAAVIPGWALAMAAPALPGCTSPVPSLISCSYRLVAVEGKALPQTLKRTRPDATGITRLTGGLLRLNTTTQGLKTGEGDYALQWTAVDVANHSTVGNDVGTYTLDSAGQLILTSMGKTVYRGELKGKRVKVQQVPLETAGFTGRVALEFSAQ